MPSFAVATDPRHEPRTDARPLTGRATGGVVAGVVLGVALTGCASSTGSFSPQPGPSASCVVLSGSDSGDTPEASGGQSPRTAPTTLGLTRPVDPAHAPVPENPDEALLFGMLYETLVRIDCSGGVYPGLASSWRSDEDGRRWTFTLRTGARFWNGENVTARDVTASWHRAEASGQAPHGPGRLRSVEVLSPERLRVSFFEPWSRPPPVLATPTLAVAKPWAGGAWPSLGTGPYRVTEASTSRTGGASGRAPIELVLEPTGGPPRGSGPPPLRVRIDPGADPRDLLAGGADLLITSDPATLDYAGLHAGLSARPLPWSRRYVLAVPGADGPGGPAATEVPDPGSFTPPRLPPSFLLELARDVVREEARPAVDTACDPEDPGPSGRPFPTLREPDADAGPPRVGYDPDDDAARALAERLVALAVSPESGGDPETRTALRMLGLGDAPPGLATLPLMPLAREEGVDPSRGEVARVVAIPRPPDGRCGEQLIPVGLPGDHVLTPLVDTRQQVVSRIGGIRVAVDGSGTATVLEGGR